jgi:Icc-related predicted phosphoesterase
MIIDCISDLHGHYPELPGGDLLIVAGDLTDPHYGWFEAFQDWIFCCSEAYKKVVLIAGNHDNHIAENVESLCPWNIAGVENICYLCDSGTAFDGLKIYGSPWTKIFPGMNPHCKAFTVDAEEELAEKWKLIPNDVDILVTHGPALYCRDFRPFTTEEKRNNFLDGFGSSSLRDRLIEIDDSGNGKRRLHVCGHIHEGYGGINLSCPKHDKCTWKIINASHVNERYEPVNKPIRIEL